MLSRVAETIYWMSRQTERAENLARFIEVTLHMTLDQPEYLIDPWQPLVEVTGDSQWFKEKYGVATRENVVQFLAFDLEYHSSMLTCLRAARENARSVREAMSSETFEELNSFYHFVRDSTASQLTDPTASFFDQVRSHALKWTGVLDSTMSHDIGWHFLNAGRLLERADKTSRILDVKYFNLLPNVSDVGTAIDDLQWSTLLLAVSGFEAYRREHHLMDVEKIVSFFVFHRSFPRSIYACVAGADWSLREIQERCGSDDEGHAVREIQSLRQRLENITAKQVIGAGLHEFIDQLQGDLNTVGESIQQDYFHVSETV